MVCLLRVIYVENLNFQILADFYETQNRRGLYHSKTKYEMIFPEKFSFYLLRMINGKVESFHF